VQAVLHVYTGDGYSDLEKRWVMARARADGTDVEGALEAMALTADEFARRQARFDSGARFDIFSLTSGALNEAMAFVEDEPWVAHMMSRAGLLQEVYAECVTLVCEYGHTAEEAVHTVVCHRIPAIIRNQRRVGFLFMDYAPEAPYFEVVNMLRKAVIVVATAFLSASDAFIQMGIALLLLTLILVLAYWANPFTPIFVGHNPFEPPIAYRPPNVRDTARGRALSKLEVQAVVKSTGDGGGHAGGGQRHLRATTEASRREHEDPRWAVAQSYLASHGPGTERPRHSSWRWSDMVYVSNWPKVVPDLITTPTLDLLSLFVVLVNTVVFIIRQQLKVEAYEATLLGQGNAAAAAAAAAGGQGTGGSANSVKSTAASAASVQQVETTATESLQLFVLAINVALMCAFAAVILSDLWTETAMSRRHKEAAFRSTPEAFMADAQVESSAAAKARAEGRFAAIKASVAASMSRNCACCTARKKPSSAAPASAPQPGACACCRRPAATEPPAAATADPLGGADDAAAPIITARVEGPDVAAAAALGGVVVVPAADPAASVAPLLRHSITAGPAMVAVPVPPAASDAVDVTAAPRGGVGFAAAAAAARQDSDDDDSVHGAVAAHAASPTRVDAEERREDGRRASQDGALTPAPAPTPPAAAADDEVLPPWQAPRSVYGGAVAPWSLRIGAGMAIPGDAHTPIDLAAPFPAAAQPPPARMRLGVGAGLTPAEATNPAHLEDSDVDDDTGSDDGRGHHGAEPAPDASGGGGSEAREGWEEVRQGAPSRASASTRWEGEEYGVML
jgi:hypothetical protein